MTVTSQVSKIQYAGDGVTDTFSVATIKFPADTVTADDVNVYQLVGSVETLLTYTTHYTISGTDIVFVTAPASGTTITIERHLALKQETNLVSSGKLIAETLEEAYDRAVMLAQQTNERINRTLLLKISSSTTDLEFPELEANKVLAVDSAGTGLELVAVDGAITFSPSLADAGKPVEVNATGTGLDATIAPKMDEISEFTASAGVTFNHTLKTDDIAEKTADAGVDVDGLHVQDGRAWQDGATYQNLVIQNNATNPTFQMDIDADFIRVEGVQVDNVNLTVDLTTGGANGLDTHPTTPEAASTWYHIWAIVDVSTPASPVVAGLLSVQYPGSGVDPTMPSGYTKKQYLGAVYNDATPDFETIYQRGRWTSRSLTTFATLNTATYTLASLSALVPQSAVGVGVVMYADRPGSSGLMQAFIAPVSSGIGERYTWHEGVAGESSGGPARLHLVEAQTVYVKTTGAGINGTFLVYEWESPI